MCGEVSPHFIFSNLQREGKNRLREKHMGQPVQVLRVRKKLTGKVAVIDIPTIQTNKREREVVNIRGSQQVFGLLISHDNSYCLGGNCRGVTLT